MKVRILVLLVLAFPSGAVAAPDGGLELVDRPSGLAVLPFDGVNEADVDRHSLSANGCFVVIESNNDVLFAGDDDTGADIFRVDRCAPGHPVALVSATASGVASDRDTWSPSISADGRYVAFTVAAGGNLVPGDTTIDHAVVLKDMNTGSVEVMSRANGNDGALVNAFEGIVAAGGNHVAFLGRGPVVTANGIATGNVENVYVRSRGTPRATFLASARSNGASVDEVRDWDVSGDGNRVALSTSRQLVAGDTDTGEDAYIMRNVIGINAAVPELVSDAGGGGDSASYVAIPFDGTRVAFTNDRVWVATCSASCGVPAVIDGGGAPPPDVNTHSPGFVPASNDEVFWTTTRAVLAGDTNGQPDMYVRDLFNAYISLATTLPGGAGNGDMTVKTVDISGEMIDVPDVVVTTAGSLELPGTDGVRPQVFGVEDGVTTLLSQVGEPRRGEVYDDGIDRRRAVSEGGRFVTFTSYSPGLGAPVRDQFWAPLLFVRDLLTATTTPVNLTAGGEVADGFSFVPSIDSLGARVAFISSATNLVADATDGTSHVYLRDLATGALQLMDRTPAGVPSSGGVGEDAVISGDGNKVAFVSHSPDLPGADGDSHGYVADVASGAVARVDTTSSGSLANGAVDDIDIDHDGSHVAFVSTSTDLAPGATMGRARAYVKDLATGAVTYASIPEDGNPDAEHRAFQLSLSGDASRLAWTNDEAGLGYGADGKQHVFVRDLAAGTTTLASVGGGDADARQSDGGLDRDGTHLAFIERTGDAFPRGYVRDLSAGSSRDTLPGRLGAFRASLDPSGRCVALNSRLPDIGPTGPDFDRVYMAALGADCPAGPGGGPGPGGVADTTAPVLSGVRMSRKRFRRGPRRTAIDAARRNSAFVFSLSEDARTSIAIARRQPGRRMKGRCVKPTRRNRASKRCKRLVVRGTLTRAQTRAGVNRVAFSGRLGKRKLPLGRYRATLAAVDAAGNRSAPARVAFRVVRR